MGDESGTSDVASERDVAAFLRFGPIVIDTLSTGDLQSERGAEAPTAATVEDLLPCRLFNGLLYRSKWDASASHGPPHKPRQDDLLANPKFLSTNFPRRAPASDPDSPTETDSSPPFGVWQPSTATAQGSYLAHVLIVHFLPVLRSYHSPRSGDYPTSTWRRSRRVAHVTSTWVDAETGSGGGGGTLSEGRCCPR